MQIFRQLDEIPADFGPTIVAIGNFDGVHRGHRFVLGQVLGRARSVNAKAVALTFDPHPVRVVRPDHAFQLITPLEAKLELLAQTGIDATVVLPFTQAFSGMLAEAFAADVLAARLHSIEVHEGDNFRFGRGAHAGTKELGEFGRRLGFAVVVNAALYAHRLVVSSSAIRSLIAAGDMRRTRWLLGRSFSVDAPPASGRGIGTRQTVPTINLASYAELLPAHGVYVTQLEIGGRCFNAVTNVGNRPTFGEDSFAVESYLLNFEPIELSPDKHLRLHFLARIREERKWPTAEALRVQIMKDVSIAQHYFRHLMRVSRR
jgi:riboflavin kinase/FMN adenylyltransferase